MFDQPPLLEKTDLEKSLALEISPIGVSLYVCEGDEPIECLAHVSKDAPDFREQTVRFSRKAQPDWGYHPKVELWFTEDEVLLRNVKLSGRSRSKRKRNAAEQLGAITPYNSEELSFDLGDADADGYTPIAAIPVKKAEDAMALARSIGMVPTAVTMSDNVDGFDMRPRLMPESPVTARISRPLQAATLVALLALPVLFMNGGFERYTDSASGIGGEFLAAVLPAETAPVIADTDGAVAPTHASQNTPPLVEKDPVAGLFDLPAQQMIAPVIEPGPRVENGTSAQTGNTGISPLGPEKADTGAATIAPTQVEFTAPSAPSATGAQSGLEGAARETTFSAKADPAALAKPIAVRDQLPDERIKKSADIRLIDASMVLHDLQASFAGPSASPRPPERPTAQPRIQLQTAVVATARPPKRPEFLPATATLDFDQVSGFSQIVMRSEAAPDQPRRIAERVPALIRPQTLDLAMHTDIAQSIVKYHELRQKAAVILASTLANRPDARQPRPPLRDVMPAPDGGGALVQIYPPGHQPNITQLLSKAPAAPVSLFAAPDRHKAPVVVASLSPELREILRAAEQDRVARALKAAEEAAKRIELAKFRMPRPPRRPNAATGNETVASAAPQTISLEPNVSNAELAEEPGIVSTVDPLLLAHSNRAPKRPTGARKAARIAAAESLPLGDDQAFAPVARPGDLKRRAAAILKKRNQVDQLVARKQTPKQTTSAGKLRLPSSARVSRTATISDGINLGDISLIGIFGKSNARSALIRTPNGRISKVKRGGRIDGWTVSSISSENVKIQKRSRTMTLRLPN